MLTLLQHFTEFSNFIILIILENSGCGGSVEITKEDKILNVTGSILLEDSGPGNRDIESMYTYFY